MVSAFLTTAVTVWGKMADEKDSKKIVVNSLNIKVYLGKKIGILFIYQKYCQGFILLFL